MGSNAVLKRMRNGVYVPVKLKRVTKDFHKRNFEVFKTQVAKHSLNNNDIPTLKQASKIMAFFRELKKKTALDIERHRTIQDEAERTVKGRDDDGDEEISSGTVSKAARVARARDKSSELRNVKASYANKIGAFVSTWHGWKIFGESLGTDVLDAYNGGFGAGDMGLRQTKVANQEVDGKRTNNAWEVIPSWDLFTRFLSKVKSKCGATSTTYLACYVKVQLFGIRDNLGGIKIRETDGRRFDPTIGDPSRED
jgi:hypothetical protein